jgi:hypothetical protein
VLEYSTKACGGSASRTTKYAVAGGPSGIVSPGCRSRVKAGSRPSKLGQLPGNSRRSTHPGVYQPPRCQPIWVSHGQTTVGGTSIVVAWLVVMEGFAMISSPGIVPVRSPWVEPARRPSIWSSA